MLHKSSDWVNNRIKQPQKHFQAPWFDKFNNAVTSLNTSKKISYIVTDEFSYIEGTPIFYWFKLTKKGFFINNSYDDMSWKSYNTDENILKVFPNKLSKWSTPESDLFIKDFVFFPLQIMTGQVKIISEAIKWAADNNTTVLFRPHPLSQETIDSDLLFNRIKQAIKCNTNYAILSSEGKVSDLVDNCKMLWTANSGVGLEAVLKRKPVAYFLKDFEHTYGPVATFCTTVQQAAEAKVADINDVKKYFSWYYNEVVIDLSRQDYIEQIRKRLNE